MLSLFAKNVGVPKFLSLGTPTFIIEPLFVYIDVDAGLELDPTVLLYQG